MSMKKWIIRLAAVLLCQHSFVYADASLPEAGPVPVPTINKPLITPTPPATNAKAYILIDVQSGKILAEKNSEEKLPPASLTKMMTLYVISNALQNGQIHLEDTVRISKEAWKTGGSRMFVKEGDHVPVEELMKGIIVDSGNDACVAMAEHLGGSEAGFADIMNQEAQSLGMRDSNFTDSTGLPDPNHYTTARDLAILGRALVRDFPQYYHFYKQKWFSYNGIRQPNRNRLLWRDSSVDGIKTGHTDEAGFCLVSSAKQNNMRLLAVILGAPTDGARADDSERLINYGFRFFESKELFQENQKVSEIPVYKGTQSVLALGMLKPAYVTIPAGQSNRLVVKTNLPNTLEAPIKRGDAIGQVVVEFDGKPFETLPLYALDDIETGGIFTRATDSIKLLVKRWITG